MVDKPNTPVPPNGSEPLKTMPKIEPANAVSGFAFPAGSAEPRDPQPKFKLPENVSAAQVRDESFRYGGGKTAGGGTPSAPIRNGRRS